MQEALQKFKETLDHAKTIAIRTGATKDISKILSSYVLHSVFLELGKNSSVDCGQIDDSAKNFLSQLFGAEQKNFENLEHTIIKKDTEKIPISELKYEKDGTILKIILNSNANFDHQKIIIEKEKIAVDLLLLLDPEETQVNSVLQNTPHKEVVKITSKDKSISVKTFEIVTLLNKDLVGKFKEALWLLLKNEDEFSKNTLLVKKEILDQNPDIAKIIKANNILKPKNFWRLLGRALQRSEIESELGVLWTFLTLDDFSKTNQDKSAVTHIVDEIKKLRTPENFLAVLWQNSKESVQAVIGGETSKIKKLAFQMGFALSSSYFFTEEFNSFSEAEIKIRSEIKKVIQ
ncbi:MAG: hypothetical protein AAB522_01425 [Patescibacteria group bacterium]